MTTPTDSWGGEALLLGQALQRAFAEAGNPSLQTVARGSGGRVSRQRLSDWRSGRHVPAQFADLEPVISYLYFAARTASNDPIVDPAVLSGPGPVGIDGEVVAEEGVVTRWPMSRWRQVWHQTTTLPANHTPLSSGSTPIPTADDVGDADKTEVDRRPLAIAVVVLLSVLVGALAVAAYIISTLTL